MTIPPYERLGPAPRWRRALACFAAVLVATSVAVFGCAEKAHAHGAVILTLFGDGRGSVWFTAQWADGHPVTEPVGMTMLATSDNGRRVGPAPLMRNGDAITYSGTLAPGVWTVVADMGTPAIGRCQGTVRVAAQGASAAPPDKTVCGPPTPAAAPPAPPAPSRSLPWVWYVTGAALIASALLALYLRPARKRR